MATKTATASTRQLFIKCERLDKKLHLANEKAAKALTEAQQAAKAATDAHAELAGVLNPPTGNGEGNPTEDE